MLVIFRKAAGGGRWAVGGECMYIYERIMGRYTIWSLSPKPRDYLDLYLTLLSIIAIPSRLHFHNFPKLQRLRSPVTISRRRHQQGTILRTGIFGLHRPHSAFNPTHKPHLSAKQIKLLNRNSTASASRQKPSGNLPGTVVEPLARAFDTYCGRSTNHDWAARWIKWLYRKRAFFHA